MSYVRRPRSLFRKARRSFKALEIRLAASETLLSLAAASLVEPRPVNAKCYDGNETA